jgi:hypothetical protein
MNSENLKELQRHVRQCPFMAAASGANGNPFNDFNLTQIAQQFFGNGQQRQDNLL